jgi:hypothetical protein
MAVAPSAAVTVGKPLIPFLLMNKTKAALFAVLAVGAGLTSALSPVVSADGRSVDLTVSNSLRRLP